MSRLLALLRTRSAYTWAAGVSVVANTLIVVTGGAVRLTSSGLGCPTWPRCTDGSLVPTSEQAGHGVIEFTNRSLTGVLVAVAAVTLVIALLQGRERRLAALAFAGIPAQAVLGGITVLTHLNPWVVAGHFLLSMAILAVTSTLLWRLVRPRISPASPSTDAARTEPAVGLLAGLVALATAVVLILGTIVTGSGPHAGDKNDSGRIRRTGLNPRDMSQLHADAVMVLVGLSVGLILLLVAVHAHRELRRAAVVLLAVELAQGTIGFVQYFTHLPVILVGFHVLGGCLVWLATLNVLLRVLSPSQQLRDDVNDQSDQRADDRAVHPDELKVSAHL